MRLAWLPVSIVALAAVLAAGCGSDEPVESQTTAQSERTTQSQTAAEEAGGAPAGAAARSCKGSVSRIGDLRVTGVGCGAGRAVAAAWSANAGCASPAAGSRFACSVSGYRCLGTATERGIAVSCGRPGRSIAFVARRG